MTESADAPVSLNGKLRRLAGPGVFLLALAMYLPANARVSLWDRDEPRYAESVREMRARGDWLIPWFNGAPRYQKPILVYWLMGLATKIAGDDAFGARLVSGISGALICLSTYVLARRMFNLRTAVFAGVFLASAPIMSVESKLATTDALLALIILGCQFCLWELSHRRSRAIALGFWILTGLAILLKGPVGPAITLAAALAARLLGGRGALPGWDRLEWKRGAVACLVLTAPWFIAAGVISRGAFYRVAAGEELLAKVARGVEMHGGFPGYYAATALVAFHPWSAILPAALLGAWRLRRESRELAYLCGWVLGPWILLELPRTKLVHYYLPAYPACAIVVAWFLDRVIAEGRNLRRFAAGRSSLALLGGVGSALAVALVAAGFIAPRELSAPLFVIAVLIGAGVFLAMAWFPQGKTREAVIALASAWCLALAMGGWWLLPAAEPFRTSRIIGDRLAEYSRKLAIEPVLGSYHEPAVIYRMGGPITVIGNKTGWLNRVRNGESAVTVLMPFELSALRSEREIAIDVLETKRIFILNRAQFEVVQFVKVGPRAQLTLSERARPAR